MVRPPHYPEEAAEEEVTQIEEFKERVIGLKLAYGETILVTTTADGDYKNIVQLVATPQGSGLLPMLDIIDSLRLNGNSMVYTFNITADCKKHYDELVRTFNSSIVVPKSEVLI